VHDGRVGHRQPRARRGERREREEGLEHRQPERAEDFGPRAQHAELLGGADAGQAGVDLRDIIEEVLDTVRPATDAVGIQVVLQLDAELRGFSSIRPASSGACSIFAPNAMDALEGRENATITITTAREQSHAAIRVADNGPGIAEDILPRVFDVFSARRRARDGDRASGRAQDRSRAHGGSVGPVEAGEGTEFKIVLPLNATEAPEAGGEIPMTKRTRRPAPMTNEIPHLKSEIRNKSKAANSKSQTCGAAGSEVRRTGSVRRALLKPATPGRRGVLRAVQLACPQMG